MNLLSVSRIILWLFIIALGVSMGAGIYETIVVNPVWMSAPQAYYQHNVANPQFAMNPGLKFWIYLTPLTGLLSVATLLTTFGTNPDHRRWRLFGAGLILITIVVTFMWFVPNLRFLTGKGVMDISTDEISTLAEWWARLNWVRIIVSTIGWLALVKALTIPLKP